jgi:ClpP class serine protease
MASKRKPRLDADLPLTAKLILEDYRAFVASGQHAPEDAVTKAFAARHAAARAALSHLEQLLKLVSEAGTLEQAKEVAASLSEWRALMPPETEEAAETDDDMG